MVYIKRERKLQKKSLELQNKNFLYKMNGEVCEAKLKQTLRL